MKALNFFSGDSFTAFGSLSHYLQFLHSVRPIESIFRVNSSQFFTVMTMNKEMVRMFHFINLTSDGYIYVNVSLWLQNQIYMLVKQQRQGEIRVKLKVATL